MNHPEIHPETYTPEARQVMEWAEEEAKEMRHTEVGTHHFLVALVRARAFNADLRTARLHVREATFELQEKLDQPLESVPLSYGSKRMLARAEENAGGDPVAPAHMVESIKRQSGHVVSVLHRMGIFIY
jgi:ATP-dependent Clp protease ATP-binding subunit ClpA